MLTLKLQSQEPVEDRRLTTIDAKSGFEYLEVKKQQTSSRSPKQTDGKAAEFKPIGNQSNIKPL